MDDTDSEGRRARGRPPLRKRARALAARRLGVDPRALAALRIALGLLLLLDLALRARHLRAHYADAGVLPRSALAARYGALADLSIHALSGAAWFQAVLFLVAAGFAVALALGYRTRLATVASWLLLASLHARNPLLLNAGDSLFRRLLFWGIFLPLGARWSVDAIRTGDGDPGPTSAGRVVSVASAALLVQVVLVYTVNGLFKLRGDLWRSGEAVRYVFGLDSMTVLFGDALADVPALLVAFDRVWFGMVLASAGLALLVGRARTALVAAFVGAHLGMLLTLRLGIFPLVSVAGLLVFLPPPVWDSVETRLPRGRARDVAVRIVGWVAGALSPLPALSLPSTGRRPSAWRHRASSGIVAALLALVLVWNAATLGYVALPTEDSPISTRQHRWDMFAPRPLGTDAWFVAPGTLASGSRLDALRGGPVEWDRPPDLASTYPSARWRKYLMDLWRPGYADLRPAFGAYLCRRWNAAHAEALLNVSVYAVEEPTRLDGPDPTRRNRLWHGPCPDPDRP